MKKPSIKKLLHISSPIFLVGVIMLGALLSPLVQAVSVQDQINQLQAENANNRSVVAQLEDQATGYQDAIDKLRAQINYLQGQINDNIAKQAELQKQISQAEAELIKQKGLLGKNIKAMYLEGEISTLEMLASSKDLSDFVDKQQYRVSVKNKIKDTLDKVTELKLQLKTQKDAVDVLLKEQETQRQQLAQSKSEQDALLYYNESQQNEFNQRTKNNQKKINDLIAAQRRANNSTSGYYFLRFPGNVASHNININDYPYANAGFSMQLGPCSFTDGYPDSPDEWGYCTRQCVSYAAWAVERSGRVAPTFYGNAKNWVNKAQNLGIPVYTSDPQPGDVAITVGGEWGHAMYVEQVNGNQIYVSQYNQQLNGEYSLQWRTFQ